MEEQPNVPPEESESSQPERQSAVEPSFFLKLSRRLPKKTPRSEAYAMPGSGSATPSKETQEALDMPPPEIPSSRQPELPPSGSILQGLKQILQEGIKVGIPVMLRRRNQKSHRVNKVLTSPHLRGGRVGHH